MADERQFSGREQGGESGEGRRRYFRRRQRPGRSGRDGGSGGRGDNSGRSDGGGREGNGPREPEPPQARRRGVERRPPAKSDARNPQLGRRRRRSRSRLEGAANPRTDLVLQEVVDLDDYQPPKSVFIYTHVSRPGSGWDSYEFRAEHFSKGGRTLEDFEIDLSKLYSDTPKKEVPRPPERRYDEEMMSDE